MSYERFVVKKSKTVRFFWKNGRGETVATNPNDSDEEVGENSRQSLLRLRVATNSSVFDEGGR